MGHFKVLCFLTGKHWLFYWSIWPRYKNFKRGVCVCMCVCVCVCVCVVVVVQLLSHVWLFGTPWTAACQASLSFTISQSMLKLMSIELVEASNYLIFCHLLLLLPSLFHSIRVFSNESVLGIRWPKYWSFSFSISPSNEYSVLISFGIDWFDLLAIEGPLKSLLQHHSWKASVLWHSVFCYGPTLTSILDYWKNHSFDYTDICQQSDASDF